MTKFFDSSTDESINKLNKTELFILQAPMWLFNNQAIYNLISMIRFWMYYTKPSQKVNKSSF